MVERVAVKNAADPEQVHAAEQRDRRTRDQEMADLRSALEVPAARRALGRVLDFAGIHHLSFAAEETHRMAFMEGQRNVGLYLVTQAEEASPELTALMLKEMKEEKRNG